MAALAKELRRASWGLTVAASAFSFKGDGGVLLLFGGLGWLVLQIVAFGLESLKNDAQEGVQK